MKNAMPNGKCSFHGGLSPSGMDSGTYVHGRYSRYIPRHFRGIYDEILQDADLTDLKEDLALLTLRSIGLVSELEEPPPSWEELREKFNAWKIAEGEAKEILTSMMEETIANGISLTHHQSYIWKELRDVIRDKTKTAAAEWSRMRDLQGLIKLDTVMVLWRAMLEAVRDNVTDPAQLKAVTTAIMRFMPPPSQIPENAVRMK